MRRGLQCVEIVETCSDSPTDSAKGEQKAHWRERKEAYLAQLRTADEDTLWVSLADKVHNVRNILQPIIGEKVWALQYRSAGFSICQFATCRLVQAREPATGVIVIDVFAVLDCTDAINNLPGLIEFKRYLGQAAEIAVWMARASQAQFVVRWT
jgi:hypothetical protein